MMLKTGRMSQPSRQHQNHQNQENQAKATAGAVTPAPAMRPPGHNAQQHQDEDDEQDSQHGFSFTNDEALI
jgi:hypothetical protein